MYPMDMEEFMMALGKEDLVKRIRNCFDTDTPMPTVLHDEAMELYRQYLVVGGMPESVMRFVETKDYILVRHTQKMILESYLNDMSKYNTANEIKKTRLTYDNVTVQLSKKNTRFQYKLIKKGGRASEFENAIEWLVLSGIVSRVYKAEQIKKPLDASPELDDFKGGMAENYVNSQLICSGYMTYYRMSDRGAEIDFVVQREGNIIPIEVKSAYNTKAKSLGIYISTFKPLYSIKLSAKNFGFEDGKKTVPLYAAFCI